jgi:hypothetical protein
MCHSKHSWVAALSPIRTGGTVWLKESMLAATPAEGHLRIVAKGADGHGDSVDLFRPRGPTASLVTRYHADASEAELSHLPLLRGVRQYGDPHLDTRGSYT